MPEETVHSDEELLKVAREAEQELAAEQQSKPVTGRRDMAQYYELGSGRADMDELPEEAQVAVAARMTAIGLGAIAMGAGDETTDPRMDMEMSEVFHDVANMAEAGSPDLGEAGAVATEWVNANPEKAAAAEEIGGQLMAGMEQPDTAGHAMHGDAQSALGGDDDMMRNDMMPMRQDMMPMRQDMMGRQDMAVPGYGALRGGFDRARGYAQRGMDYGAEGVMRGAGGVDAAGRTRSPQPLRLRRWRSRPRWRGLGSRWLHGLPGDAG